MEASVFKVNKAEWDLLSQADRDYIREWRIARFGDMETCAEDLTLPSGKEFRAFADGRGFVLETPQGGR